MLAIRTILALVCIASLPNLHSSAAVQAKNSQEAVLHLATGDFLAGRPLPTSDSQSISWAPSFAQGTFKYPWAAVTSVQFSRPDQQVQPQGEWCFELHGGDLVFGDLLSLDETWLTIRTDQQEEFKLRKASIRRVSSWNNGADLLYLGPDDLTGWTSSKKKGWRQVSGALKSREKQVSLFRNLKLPEKSCIELELSWDRKPDFSVGLGVDGTDAVFKQAFMLDVLSSSLVAVRETQKEADLSLVKDLDKGHGRVNLLLYLDQAAGRMIVASPSGRIESDLRVVASTDPPKQQGQVEKLVGVLLPNRKKGQKQYGGIQFVNRDGDLTIERLRVSRWNGQSAESVEAGQARVQLRSGETLAGELTSYDSQRQEYQFSGAAITSEETNETTERKIVAAEILDFSFAGEPQTAQGSVRVSLHEGMRLHGTLTKIGEDSLELTSSALQGNLTLPLEAVRAIVGIPDGGEAQALKLARKVPNGQLARLELATSSVKGILVPGRSDDQASCLHWQPRGADTALPLSNEITGRLVYRDPPPKPKAHSNQRVQPNRVQRPQFMGGLLNAFTGGSSSTLGEGSPAIYLKAGDKLPCRIESIDDRGVTFKSPMTEATFVPHSEIKAAELIVKGVDGRVTSDRREQLLTLPRLQRDNPPTHLLVSIFGDYLRCRVVSLDDKRAIIEVRLEKREIERRRIARIIWLGDPPPIEKTETASLDEVPAHEQDATPDDSDPNFSGLRVQAVRSDGVRLTFMPEEFDGKSLLGTSRVLAKCSVDLGQVDQLLLGEQIEQVAAELAYQRWKMHHAVEPREGDEEGSAGAESPLVGQPAPDMSLPFVIDGKLDKKTFKVSDYRGKVLVLDFWASWCGPCTQAMPMIEQLSEEFANRNVEIVAVNLQESPPKIARALERMKVAPTVALDRDGVATERYQVSGIPQTVVIDREGTVARVFIGAGPNFQEQLRAILEEVSFPAK
ncbi:TlpA family protein disulfide reductase [Adhaeretor mobilis]|uniref:TlpA family protein disulfide reductase n=1 Tax=Adhaeretor mobilis TaxID=1930276 RepID=UPI0011A05E5D|nr:TlpA disulfide reductase family protein [Adhaeretor mobilis]